METAVALMLAIVITVISIYFLNRLAEPLD